MSSPQEPVELSVHEDARRGPAWSRLTDFVNREVLRRRGFVIRRHPAARRQRLLQSHGVDLVLDVGAATGSYARELREFGYRRRIVSFEPLREPFTRLAQTAAGDPLWEVRNCALGAETQRAEMHVASNSDSSSLLPMASSHREAAPHVDYVGVEQVEVARLDLIADEVVGEARRVFLKLDTQGFERSVLAGAGDVLHRCIGIQLELSFVTLYEGGMLVDEAVAWAYDQGYRLTALDTAFTDPAGAALQGDGMFFRQDA